MSRSGYDDDCYDNWALVRWRGAVARAIKGYRGQKLLQDLAAALDAMPEKRLIRDALEEQGGVCALGCVGRARGLPMEKLDPYEYEDVAKAFHIAPALAQEIAYINDEWNRHQTPEERWQTVRRWVAENIKPE